MQASFTTLATHLKCFSKILRRIVYNSFCKYLIKECAKLRALRTFVLYVYHVPTCFTFSRAFVPLLLMCLPLFTCHTCLYFLRVLLPFIFLRALRVLSAFIFESVSNFRRALFIFPFFNKIWNHPWTIATSWYKQEGGRINQKIA